MNISNVFNRIFKGSMPRLYENDQVAREQYYESYLQTYISRDIKDLSQVADETTFLNFMSIVAARTASNVNYEALANEVGVSSPTAKQWLSILEPIQKEPSQEDKFAGSTHLKTQIGTGAVLCMPADIIPIDKKNWYIPAWLV